MNKFIVFLCTLFAFGMLQDARAGGVVRIVDGDCAAFQAAAAALPGSEAALIEMAPNGSYFCPISVVGDITLEGNGATLNIASILIASRSQIAVAPGARLTLRNVVLHSADAQAASKSAPAPKYDSFSDPPPAIDNAGTLVLESVSMADESGFGYVTMGGVSQHFLANSGNLVLRNVTIKDVYDNVAPSAPESSGLFNGNVEISHSTIIENEAYTALFGVGTFDIANSIVIETGAPICTRTRPPSGITSHGGNVFSDAVCATPSDKVAQDPGVLDYGRHGGVVDTFALAYNSPAIGNGVAANCEATDARGHARNGSACDSGAYEFGGGEGRLDQTGMSGCISIRTTTATMSRSSVWPATVRW